MTSDAERQPEHHRLPPEESWRAGRTWVGVLFVLLAGFNLVLALTDLTDGDPTTTRGAISTWLRLLVVVVFLLVAVGEFRRRVTVDTDGIHLVEPFRRRTYPWQDVAGVRLGRPTLLGDAFVYVLRYGDKHVELPNSGGHLRLLERWHTAVSTR